MLRKRIKIIFFCNNKILNIKGAILPKTCFEAWWCLAASVVHLYLSFTMFWNRYSLESGNPGWKRLDSGSIRNDNRGKIIHLQYTGLACWYNQGVLINLIGQGYNKALNFENEAKRLKKAVSWKSKASRLFLIFSSGGHDQDLLKKASIVGRNWARWMRYSEYPFVWTGGPVRPVFYLLFQIVPFPQAQAIVHYQPSRFQTGRPPLKIFKARLQPMARDRKSGWLWKACRVRARCFTSTKSSHPAPITAWNGFLSDSFFPF